MDPIRYPTQTIICMYLRATILNSLRAPMLHAGASCHWVFGRAGPLPVPPDAMGRRRPGCGRGLND